MAVSGEKTIGMTAQMYGRMNVYWLLHRDLSSTPAPEEEQPLNMETMDILMFQEQQNRLQMVAPKLTLVRMARFRALAHIGNYGC